MDKNYQYDLKLDREFEEEEMLPETKSLLSLIFKNYLATEEQRKLIEQRRIPFFAIKDKSSDFLLT